MLDNSIKYVFPKGYSHMDNSIHFVENLPINLFCLTLTPIFSKSRFWTIMIYARCEISKTTGDINFIFSTELDNTITPVFTEGFFDKINLKNFITFLMRKNAKK